MKRILSCLMLCLILARPAFAEPLTREQAERLAWEAIPTVYQFTQKELATCALIGYEAKEEGFAFQFASALGSFSVTVPQADGSVLCEPDAEAFWAQANLSADGRAVRSATIEWEAARDGLSFDFWSLEDKAAFAAQYYPSESSEDHYCGQPAEGEQTPDQAIEIAHETLSKELGYAEGELSGLIIAPWFYRDRPGTGYGDEPRAYYSIVFWKQTGNGGEGFGNLVYQTQVDVDAATGEVLGFYDPAQAVG